MVCGGFPACTLEAEEVVLAQPRMERAIQGGSAPANQSWLTYSPCAFVPHV